MEPQGLEKFRIMFASFLIHIAVGSVYAWSHVASAIITEVPDWTLQHVTFAFSIAIFCIGMFATAFGHCVQRKGSRFCGILAAIIICLGFIGAGISVKVNNLPMLYFCYGIIGGAGLSLGYVTPFSILKYFHKRRGFIIGTVVMGIGVGTTVYTVLLQKVLPFLGITAIADMLFWSGFIYLFIILLAAFNLPRKTHKAIHQNEAKFDIQAKHAIRSVNFYYLWIILFVNIACGLSLISVIEYFSTDILGFSCDTAAMILMLSGIINGLGRVWWPFLSDYLTRPLTFCLLFIVQILSFLALIYNPDNQVIFVLSTLLIISCYGGGFPLIASFVADLFGTKESSIIHGYILSAWAIAGLLAPNLMAYFLEQSSNYQHVFFIYIGFLGLALALAFLSHYNSYHRAEPRHI